MKIDYLGHACFRITSENGTRIITDPYQGVGYELPQNLTAEIVTVSHGHFDHNNISAVGENPTIIDRSGISRVYDIDFNGLDTYHDNRQGALRGKNIVYSFIVDGVRCCHLGDIGEPWHTNFLQNLENTDVLMIPVGGTYTIDTAQAQVYLENLKPKIAILMHFKPKDGCLDIASQEEVLSAFKNAKTIEKSLEITRERLINQTTEILIMERIGE